MTRLSCWSGRIVITLLVLTTGVQADRPTQKRGAGSDERARIVSVAGKSIQLSPKDWKPLPNDYNWAVNFEATSKDPRHAYPRVVTIFKLKMTDDRREGVRISSNEYLELWVDPLRTIIAQVRADKGGYWVLSREGFSEAGLGVDIAPKYTLTEAEFAQIRFALQAQIDTTRYLLQSVF